MRRKQEERKDEIRREEGKKEKIKKEESEGNRRGKRIAPIELEPGVTNGQDRCRKANFFLKVEERERSRKAQRLNPGM